MEFLAGNRIRGTTAERPALGLPSGSVGGWVELGRVTASVGEVTGLANKRYLMVLGHHIQGSGNSGLGLQFNGDTGSNYPRRYSGNGGTDATPTTETNVFIDTNGSTVSGKEWFTTMYIANKSDKEKLGIYHTVYNRNGLGAGQHPHRIEGVYKWTNTSNPISSIKFSDFNGTAMNAASEVVVLGWDPTDTHTTNFWGELASVDLSGGSADVLDSGTFTAKKYLWVQAFMEQDGGTISGVLNFNNDTGSNYARRRSSNGASDSTETAHTSIDVRGGETKNRFENLFIINNASNEKLVIANMMVPTAGAGTAPDRTEYVAKWANTSDQITSVKWTNGDAGSYGTSSIIKVWGSD